jgi:lambda family phage portal protein
MSFRERVSNAVTAFRGGPAAARPTISPAVLAIAEQLSKSNAESLLNGGGASAGGDLNIGGGRYFGGSLTSAASDINPHLNSLISQSRSLIRNSPIASAASSVEVDSVIGTGLTMRCEINHNYLGITEEQGEEWKAFTQQHFELLISSRWCDYQGQLTGYQQQRLAYLSAWESGDCFAVLTNPKESSGSPFGLAVQLIEGDYVCNPKNKSDTSSLQRGIQLDASGAPVGAWFAKEHPGACGSTKNEWTYRPFVNDNGDVGVIQLAHRKRIGQVRGLPVLAPVVNLIAQMTRLTEAEVQKAVNAAVLNIFLKMDPKAFSELFDDSSRKTLVDRAVGWGGDLQPGKAINLLPGEEPVNFGIDSPNPNLEPFLMMLSKQVGAAVGIPVEVLYRSFNASYSASRASILQAWQTFRGRRDWVGTDYGTPIYRAWLDYEVAIGRIRAPGYFADKLRRVAWGQCRWVGDGPGSIEPLKEALAIKERIDMNLTSLEQEKLQFDGGDWRSTHVQRKREAIARNEIPLPLQPSAAPAANVVAAMSEALA